MEELKEQRKEQTRGESRAGMQEEWSDLHLLQQAEDRSWQGFPERQMFAKGITATGEFQPYMTLEDYTTADFLCDPFQATPAAVRFSLASSSRGSGDTSRDLRGFAVKLYTREGNCDLLSLSVPEGLCRSGADFFSLMDCIRPDPATGIRDNCGYLRYATEHPQAWSGVLRLYGCRGIVKEYGTMESWSAGTMLWKNKKGERFFVRHRWVPEKAPLYLSGNEGEFLCGFDPDNLNRQLYNQLASGQSAVYELQLHVIPLAECQGGERRYCDPTLGWDESVGQQVQAGRLRLTGIPQEQLQRGELLCYSPENLVSGMELPRDSFLHQMALVVRPLQSARLGKAMPLVDSNRHSRRLRPKISAHLISVFGEERCAPESVYEEQARHIWERAGDAERESIARNVAQRLMFSSGELQDQVVNSLSLICEDLVKQIEMQLAF